MAAYKYSPHCITGDVHFVYDLMACAHHSNVCAGFALTGTEVRTTNVSVDEKDTVEVTSGMHSTWLANLACSHLQMFKCNCQAEGLIVHYLFQVSRTFVF